jgi:ABC-type Mn2+/Zn2+ transport system ATPase subunit
MEGEMDLNASPLVELTDVEYFYPSGDSKVKVLNSISLTIHAGEIVRVTGRNGSGKTTLLRVISDILVPTAGVRNEKEGLHSVYLDQNASEFLGEALTVREQLVVGRQTVGALASSRDRSLRKNLIEELIGYGVHLEDKLESFISELSGGQRQIVALLSVLLGKANLLVLDEFTAAMDAVSTATSNRLVLRAARESGVGVVFVSHSFQGDFTIDKELHLSET